MLRVGHRKILFVIAALTLCTCIDPYHPKLSGYESFLVVDGSITDEATAYAIKLSRTTREQNARPSLVTDATVEITDENGNRAELTTLGDGIYKTDENSFKGEIGRYYTLHISTSDGNQYESEPSTMSYVPDIDSIYYAKEAKLVNNATATEVGLSIFLDTKKGLTDNNYYRWDFEETWKFKVPNATKFDYINDSTIIPIKQVKDIGWKSSKNDQVILHSVLNGSDRIVKEPIQFIVAKTSDRLTLEYSILVRQYSISKSEYEFWNSMIKVNNSGADIFASQPFPVMSNIHNIKNPAEMVLGYFGVSAVKQKRMFISYSEIIALDLPFYHYPCERIERSPADYSPPWGNPPTWDDVYNMFIYAKYAFVEPVYDPVTLRLKKLVFAKPSCADSEVTGTSIKPDFWIDLD